MIRRTHALRAWRPLCVAAVALLASCMDGPFPRVNPNDETAEFTMRIVSSSDTLSPDRPRAVLQVITEPAMTGYVPVWGVPPGSWVYHAGNGVIVLAVVPPATTAITVTASFQFKSASMDLVIVPAP